MMAPQRPDAPADSEPAPTTRRRLAAVLLADVAGYSRMMERDEAGTHERLRALRVRIVDPAIEHHRGRPVRSKGDDWLVEFASAADALECALAIQAQLVPFNRDLPAARRIELRIGINLGDILIDGADIAGDGVNVAARLQALAQPGTIAVSAAVHEQTRQVEGVEWRDLGPHRVKNMSRPVHVFAACPAGAAHAGLVASVSHARLSRRGWLALGLALLLALGAAAGWWFTMHGSAPVAPKRQSLALMRVASVAPGPAAEAFAGALAARLALSMRQTLGSGGQLIEAALGTDAGMPTQVGPRLGVRYLARTTLRALEPAIRVDAVLIETQTGTQLWSASVEATPQSGQDVPIELVGQIAEGMAAAVRAAELARGPAPDPPDAAWLTLKARALLPNTTDHAALLQVRQMNERALQIDPDFVPAMNGLAETLVFEAQTEHDQATADALVARATQLSLRAIAAAPDDAHTWRVRALVAQDRGEFGAANEAIERALRLNPASAEAHSQRGLLLGAMGQAEEQLDALDRALRIHPTADNVGVLLHFRCQAQLLLGRYAEAIASCKRATAFAPDWTDFVLLTAALAMNDQPKEAAAARAELLRREPDFRIGRLADSRRFSERTREQRERHLIAGLRRAGVPE